MQVKIEPVNKGKIYEIKDEDVTISVGIYEGSITHYLIKKGDSYIEEEKPLWSHSSPDRLF